MPDPDAYTEAEVSGEGAITDDEIDAIMDSGLEIDPVETEGAIELRFNSVDYTREEVRTAAMTLLKKAIQGKRTPGVKVLNTSHTSNVTCPEKGCNTKLSGKVIEVERGRTKAKISYLLGHILREHPEAQKLIVGFKNHYKKTPDQESVDAKKLLSVLFGKKR